MWMHNVGIYPPCASIFLEKPNAHESKKIDQPKCWPIFFDL